MTAPRPLKFGDDPAHDEANIRHEEFLVIAREVMDATSNDATKSIRRLQRRLGMFVREAQDLIFEVQRERGLPFSY